MKHILTIIAFALGALGFSQCAAADDFTPESDVIRITSEAKVGGLGIPAPTAGWYFVNYQGTASPPSHFEQNSIYRFSTAVQGEDVVRTGRSTYSEKYFSFVITTSLARTDYSQGEPFKPDRIDPDDFTHSVTIVSVTAVSYNYNSTTTLTAKAAVIELRRKDFTRSLSLEVFALAPFERRISEELQDHLNNVLACHNYNECNYTKANREKHLNETLFYEEVLNKFESALIQTLGKGRLYADPDRVRQIAFDMRKDIYFWRQPSESQKAEGQLPRLKAESGRSDDTVRVVLEYLAKIDWNGYLPEDGSVAGQGDNVAGIALVNLAIQAQE